MTKKQSRKWAILAVVTLVSFLTNVDATIVVIGLPRLMHDLHLTMVTGMWTITSYLITSTVFLLPAGRWADVAGTKRIFLWGLGLFTVATVLCGLAGSGTSLLVCRLLQGVGAALATATATPIMMRTFPPDQLGLAIGINSTSWVIGAIVGPVAGGALISAFGWQSIFFVSAPFALIGLAAGWFLLKDSTTQGKAKTDWAGVFTFGAGLSAFLVALSQGQEWGWGSARILGLFGAAVFLWIAFVVAELRVRHPLFQLRLFTNKPYTTGLGITLCYCIGYFSITTLLALYLQGAQHLSPLESGLLLIPLSAPQLVTGPFGGRLADRFGPVRLILAGGLCIGTGLLLLGSLGEELSITWIVLPPFLISVANGFAWPSLAKAVLTAAPHELAGSASGMFYTVYNVGRALSQTLALIIVELCVTPQVASQMFFGMGIGQESFVKSAVVRMTDTGFQVFAAFFVLVLLLGLVMKRHLNYQFTRDSQRDN